MLDHDSVAGKGVSLAKFESREECFMDCLQRAKKYVDDEELLACIDNTLELYE